MAARQHFLLILGLGAAVWLLLLRFFFPGYLDPFVPFHVDHFSYLGLSAEGYGLMRYLHLYPRPLGYLIFDLIGRLGTRGMLIPIFALTLLNAGLLIRYVERLSGRLTSTFTLTLYFFLVFANPEHYSSVKEDILAVVCLTCLLFIFHLWQTYIESGGAWRIALIILLAFLSSYVKETYFATMLVFFLFQVIDCAGRRKTAIALAVVSVVIALISLHINAQRGYFVRPTAVATDAYFKNWSPVSIFQSYLHLLRFLIYPAPGLLVIGALIALSLRNRRAFLVGLAALTFVATTLLPHALLPNHLEDQYAWLGAFFFFVPLLLADGLIPKGRGPLLIALVAALLICVETLREYRASIPRGMAGWLREQEGYARTFLDSWPIMKSVTKSGEHELVVAPVMAFQPFTMPGYVQKSLGTDKQWTVVLPDRFGKARTLNANFVHRADVTSLAAYDHIFIFSPHAKLLRLYSKEDADAIWKAGGFKQFPALGSNPAK
jgi:hypothetical protein